MTNNTDPVRALIAKWQAAPYGKGDHDYYVDGLRACARELESSLASAPPSATVRVEGLVAKLRAVLCDPAGNVCIEGSDADCAEVQGALDALETLAQQPAAPSDEHLIETGCYQTVIDRHSQPATSAEPPYEIEALFDALSNLEHDNYERSYSGSKNREADAGLIRAALERYAALAAQQQGGAE